MFSSIRFRSSSVLGHGQQGTLSRPPVSGLVGLVSSISVKPVAEILIGIFSSVKKQHKHGYIFPVVTFSDNLLLFQYAQNVNSESATKKQESKQNYIKAWVIGGFQSSANNIQTELNGLNMEYIILLWQSFMHFEVKNFFKQNLIYFH